MKIIILFSLIISDILKKKFISEDDIAKVISRNFAIKKIELSADNIKPEVIKALPNIFIKKEELSIYNFFLQDFLNVSFQKDLILNIFPQISVFFITIFKSIIDYIISHYRRIKKFHVFYFSFFGNLFS